jgi:hypothetical protein
MVELRGFEPLTFCMPCMPVSSDGVALGPVAAGESGFNVWGRLVRSGEACGRWDLVWSWFACPPLPAPSRATDSWDHMACLLLWASSRDRRRSWLRLWSSRFRRSRNDCRQRQSSSHRQERSSSSSSLTSRCSFSEFFSVFQGDQAHEGASQIFPGQACHCRRHDDPQDQPLIEAVVSQRTCCGQPDPNQDCVTLTAQDSPLPR